MAIKTGDTARVVAPIVQGEVTSVKFNEDTGAKRILLAFTDAEGNASERWFTEEELELVAPTE